MASPDHARLQRRPLRGATQSVSRRQSRQRHRSAILATLQRWASGPGRSMIDHFPEHLQTHGQFPTHACQPDISTLWSDPTFLLCVDNPSRRKTSQIHVDGSTSPPAVRSRWQARTTPAAAMEIAYLVRTHMPTSTWVRHESASRCCPPASGGRSMLCRRYAASAVARRPPRAARSAATAAVTTLGRAAVFSAGTRAASRQGGSRSRGTRRPMSSMGGAGPARDCPWSLVRRSARATRHGHAPPLAPCDEPPRGSAGADETDVQEGLKCAAIEPAARF